MTFYYTNDGHFSYKVFYWSTDTVPPSIAITSPVATGQTYNTSTATVNVSGTASDNVGVVSVIWDNNRGGGGTASGTTNWSATGIVLQAGANIITVHAYDAAGNTQTASITVNYTTVTTGNLTVTVRRSDTNALLSGATVTLSGGPSSPPSQVTTGDGITTFWNLLAGSYTVSASLAGFQSNSVSTTLVANTGMGIMVPLTPVQSTGTIQVRTNLNGAPWVGTVNYTLSGPTIITGNWYSSVDFLEKPAGTWTLTYNSGGPGSGASLTNITPSPPVQTLGGGSSITFTLNFSTAPVTGNLTVTVRRSDTNAALPGARLLISGPNSIEQTTGSDGTTTFRDITIGSYTVQAWLEGYQENSAPATVVANTTTPVTVSLTPTGGVPIPATPSNPSPGSTSSPGPTQSSSTVTLSWDAVSGATYYSLGVTDMTTGGLVNTYPTGTSSTVSLTAAKQYQWDVAACNASGCSSYTTLLYFQTPTPQKRVVILVHGVNADSGSFGLMRNFLESTGKFRVYYFNYSSLSNVSTGADTPIVLIGSYFKHKCIDNIKKGKVCASSGEDPDQAPPIEDIENIDTSSVDIVAHSMGGLVALSYVSGMATNKYEHDVGRLVTLATPFFGSPFANFFQGFYEGREMAPASEFLWHLQQWWTHDSSFSDFAKTKKADILNVVGTMGSDGIPDSDTIVPVVSAVLPDLDIRSRYVRKCHANFSWLNCNGSDAIAYVLNESHPSYKLVESFLRNGSDPDNCPEPECSPTPPTTTGDLFVRFVEKLSPTIPISVSVSAAAKVLTLDPNPNDLGGAPWVFSNGSAGTLLVTHLPAGPYRTTVHGSEINLVNFYQDEVLPITSIHAGRTTVLPQLELQKKTDRYTVTLATPKDSFVAGKDVFLLDVQLCCTIPTVQLNSYQSLASDALSQSTLIDGYIWTEIPGGGRFFLQPDFINFNEQKTPVVLSFPIENFAGSVLSMFIPPDLPTGTYTFFAVGVVPGSDPLNSANWVTNRAELAVTFTK